VHIGSELCGRPPSIESLMDVLRKHHRPGSPAHLIYSSHEGCEGLTTRFFTQLIRAQWNLNTTRPQRSDSRHSKFHIGAPVIEQSDGTFGDIDRHLCAMVSLPTRAITSRSKKFLFEENVLIFLLDTLYFLGQRQRLHTRQWWARLLGL